jgi:deoxyribonuclease V
VRLAAVDVHYMADASGQAAVVVFSPWSAGPSGILEEHVCSIADVAPYEPGAFYKRELPCILRALSELSRLPEVVVVDGHAWLDGGRPGLGARLLEAEPRLRSVVGVAKTLFHGSSAAAVRRGRSAVPLWVDEAGGPVDGPRRIAEMHGPHRIPTMLRRVDQLCRMISQGPS